MEYETRLFDVFRSIQAFLNTFHSYVYFRLIIQMLLVYLKIQKYIWECEEVVNNQN